MNLDSIKDFFSNLGARDLPLAGAVLVAIAVIIFVFRTKQALLKLLLLLVAAGLIAGAYWWRTQN